MKAKPARELIVGDHVRASFGCYQKTCEIIGINWPTFTLRTQDYRGHQMIRKRRYTSIWFKCEPEGNTPPTTSPFWLTWPSPS